MESACPRTIAASRLVILRAGSGRRALPGARPGRSAAKLTSSSGVFAIARRQAVTARLNGSVGASFDPVRNLLLEVVIFVVVPTKAGTHNHRLELVERLAASLYCEIPRYGSGLALAFAHLAGTTCSSRQRHVDRRFCQFCIEAALIEFGHQRPLQFVAFVEEGDAEGETDIAEDVGVPGPGDHRARAHHGRQIAIGEGVACEISEPHHLVDDVASL